MTSMPVESTDYESFDYRRHDEQPLTLEEAIRKASQLRRHHPQFVYRVNSTDGNMSGFRIEEIAKQKAYREKLARLSNLWTNLLLRVR